MFKNYEKRILDLQSLSLKEETKQYFDCFWHFILSLGVIAILT